MKPPERGDTVKVMRDGALYIELVVQVVEPDRNYEGWHMIHGYVRHETGPLGPWSERRAVFATPVEGGVRMLSTGERLTSDPRPIPGQRCYGSVGPEDGDCDYRMPHGEHPIGEAP